MVHQNMSMVDQVTAIWKATNFHFMNIGRIQKSLTKESAETVIHALVTSRVGNNNALLARLPNTQIKRLQKTAAHTIWLHQHFHLTPLGSCEGNNLLQDSSAGLQGPT